MSDHTLLNNPSRSNGPLSTPAAIGHVVQSQPLTDDAVAARAYEKFVARGRTHGRDVEDWTAARTELLAETRGPKR
jgi:hypothetical protein